MHEKLFNHFPLFLMRIKEYVFEDNCIIIGYTLSDIRMYHAHNAAHAYKIRMYHKNIAYTHAAWQRLIIGYTPEARNH